MDERKDEQQQRAGGREGFGDDGGARVGRPDAGRAADDSSMARLSHAADDRGIEGGTLGESQGARSQRRADGSSMEGDDARQEGAAGGRGTLDQSQREQSGMQASGGTTGGAANQSERGSTGAGAEGARGIHNRQEAKGTEDGDRAGSEPLEGRGREHKPSYGGEGGAPRTSSDQRENANDPKIQ